MGANAVFSAKDVDLSALGTFDVVHVGGTFLMPAFDGPDAAQYSPRRAGGHHHDGRSRG